jgi:hypothetical protein
MESKMNYTCCNAGPDECDALEGVCRCPDHCPFYKTIQESIGSRRRADSRLRSLPEVQQAHIARKYHGGSRPWATMSGGD